MGKLLYRKVGSAPRMSTPHLVYPSILCQDISRDTVYHLQLRVPLSYTGSRSSENSRFLQ